LFLITHKFFLLLLYFHSSKLLLNRKLWRTQSILFWLFSFLIIIHALFYSNLLLCLLRNYYFWILRNRISVIAHIVLCF
jgi:hypothetical protein